MYQLQKYGHTIDNCIKGKVFTTRINKCPICNDPHHVFEAPYKGVSRKI